MLVNQQDFVIEHVEELYKNNNITNAQRQNVLDKIFDLTNEPQCDLIMIATAVKIVDQILKHVATKDTSINLVGASAYWLSMKLHCVDLYYYARNIVKLFEGTIKAEDLVHLECTVVANSNVNLTSDVVPVYLSESAFYNKDSKFKFLCDVSTTSDLYILSFLTNNFIFFIAFVSGMCMF